MFKALVDAQSLIDPKFLENYTVVDTYEERWPGEDPEVLYMSKVRIEDHEVESFVKELSSRGLEDEWFTLVWNEDRVYAVFKGHIIPMQNVNPWNEKEFLELVEYGKQHAIDKKYFLNMRSVMDTW